MRMRSNSETKTMVITITAEEATITTIIINSATTGKEAAISETNAEFMEDMNGMNADRIQPTEVVEIIIITIDIAETKIEEEITMNITGMKKETQAEEDPEKEEVNQEAEMTDQVHIINMIVGELKKRLKLMKIRMKK